MKENKKIKSVKLAKDYRTLITEIKAGAYLSLNNGYWGINATIFPIDAIINCKTGLFEFEYEQEDEHFEYSEKADSYSQVIVDTLDIYYKKFLNALADWCEKKYPVFVVDILIGYNSFEEMLTVSKANKDYHYGTIKLNNYDSTNLFISELNREENKAVKEYFINLLKSGRLR